MDKNIENEENTGEKKPPITHEERLKLAEKLDKELDEFINGLEKKRYTEGWPEDRWEEEMAKHPFFMTKPPEPGDELHPLLEGIQQLKYDPAENTAEELGNSYKEDGNFNFKYKKYRLAIYSYTEGIMQKFENPELRATLHNNRAAAHFYLKNYRSALKDCEMALKHKPDYLKAIIRAANCCFEISQFDKCTEYCDRILLNDPENGEVLKLRQKAVNTKKMEERNKRKRETVEKNKQIQEENLIQEILNRGIKMDVNKNSLRIEHLEPKFPEIAQSPVHLDENNCLVWPVMLMFPEYKITEFIQQYSENDSIYGLLSILFEEPAPWDEEQKYSLDSLNVYFENKQKLKLHQISTDLSLKEVLLHKEYILVGGIPTFIVFAKGSNAEKHFLQSYK